MNRSETLDLQHRLISAGFPLTADGRYGPATAEAYRRYLNGLGPNDPPAAAVDSLPAPPPVKPWWASKAVLGSLTTILVAVASLFGLALPQDQVGLILSSLAGLVSGGLALYGSITRKAPIDPLLVLPGVRLGGVRALPASPARSAGDPGAPLDDPFVSGGG